MHCTETADPETAEPSSPPRPPLSLTSGRSSSSAIRDLLRITRSPGILSLAGGLPAPECLPTDRVRSAADRALSISGPCGPTALQYGPTEGIDALRETVAVGTLASPTLGRANQVVITTGSQQGLALVARVLVDPGTPVAVEDPVYLGARQVFAGAGAEIVGIPVDANGLDTDDLELRLRQGLRPSIVTCVPNFSNPSGACFPIARRLHLATLAQQYGFVIVEDDPYHALYFDDPPPPPIAQLAPDRTVTLGSASKVIAPGLRVGWLHAPEWLLQPIVRAKQTLDLHTPALTQLIVTEILNDAAFLEPHLESTRDRYERRARALHAAVSGFIDAAMPSGGMFLWGCAEVDTTATLDQAITGGVAYVPGDVFTVEDLTHRWLRLSFATLNEERLTEAAARLESAFAGIERPRPQVPDPSVGSHRPRVQ